MTDVAMIERPELSDDEITAMIADPAKIETHDIALEIMAVLDAEIANIQTQVDAAVIESNIRPLSEERQGWLRRATYAGAMRRNERHRIMQRDKEIRGTKIVQRPKKDPGEGLLKQERLKIEAETRRDARKLLLAQTTNRAAEIAQQRRDLSARHSFQHRFYEAAARLLPADTLQQIKDAAALPLSTSE